MSFDRENNRQQEIKELTSQGKIPHDIELETHPEKSLEGRMCKWQSSSSAQQVMLTVIDMLGLMGKVAGAINEIKPAKAM